MRHSEQQLAYCLVSFCGQTFQGRIQVLSHLSPSCSYIWFAWNRKTGPIRSERFLPPKAFGFPPFSTTLSPSTAAAKSTILVSICLSITLSSNPLQVCVWRQSSAVHIFNPNLYLQDRQETKRIKRFPGRRIYS